MALLRKLMYKKPADGLVWVFERIFVFDYCFRTQDLEQEDYKAYFGSIISQYKDTFPDSSIMILNFREGEKESRIASALLEHDITIMDYPRDYEGFPLLSIEVIHHFLKSCESWLSLSLQNVLLVHFELGGWPVLAFMVAALSLYRKNFTVESKALDMVHKQVPSYLIPAMSPMNHVPSQLRYLKYVSRRNADTEWPPGDKILTLDCVIMRMIPDFDGKGGCCPIYRIYGRDPLLHVDKTPKLLFSTPRRPKYVRYYNRAENDVAKCDINCHIEGDVVLECISLHDDMVKEKIMYRAMFNTAFIESNMLMLNRDEIDIFKDAKGQFHKNFRVELIFSELDSTASMVPEDLSGFEQEGLPMEAFDKVTEMFSSVDWLESHLRETATSSSAVTAPAPTSVKTQPHESLHLSKFNRLAQERLWAETQKPGETSRVKFNVGGKVFETTSTTLAMSVRKSYFGSMFDENWDLQLNPAGDHFIDRNPDCFSILLDLLRTGELYIPPNIPEKRFYQEALFYGLTDHVRSAKWGQFNGNRLQPSKSITGHATGDGTAIRASPDGGCCVAHGSMVHIYDWMLEEHPPINLDYQRVNDAVWVGPVDPTGLVISTCERIGRGQGGMGLFNSITGELKYKYNVTHESVTKSYTAGALSFNDDGSKLFSSCKGRSNEYGIGVWDQITGQQVDFFYEPQEWSLGDANKLQWLNSSNCLFVATLSPRKDNCYISLIDFRSNSMVWSWSDMLSTASSDDQHVRDAMAMEENNSICVVNEFEDLGFMDMRRDSGSVRWNSRSPLVKGKIPAEPCYPKLALHGGQLFLSINDCISVFCGSDWVLTSRIRRSFGGSICDFSIGGDRLFALHSEENVFDIWETPPPPPPIV